jgi:hypothetical protein
VQGSQEDVHALRDAGLAFVNWNYNDADPEAYFPYLNALQCSGVDQVISPGCWTWRQLFPSLTETRRSLPVFTRAAWSEGVKDSITCAWNDTGDCFRELHYLNYAVAAEHQWNGTAETADASSFVRRWVRQFFGIASGPIEAAHAWLGDSNANVYAAARHDHRYPRDFGWRPIATHAVFWNYPRPGSGTVEDAEASAAAAEQARALREERTRAVECPRNGSVLDLVAYELERAAWLFESVRFNTAPTTGEAARLAEELRRLKERFSPRWKRTNIPQCLPGIENRFDVLIEKYVIESHAITPWDGAWGPAWRMQTGRHPM